MQFSQGKINYTFFKKNHLFHLVKPSGIPLFLSFSVFIFINILISIMTSAQVDASFYLSFLFLFFMINYWFYKLSEEYSDKFVMNIDVERNYILGMLLFVCSEVLLFGSVFWAFFNSSLSPSIFIGAIWPPIGIDSMNPYEIPLLNTLLLLSSGATANNFYYLLRHLTIKHEFAYNLSYHSYYNNWKILYGSLLCTVILGFLFMLIQVFEYVNSLFSISDSVYGSTFFMSTGLHGLHVFLGLSVLLFILFRLMFGEYDKGQVYTISTTCALIYWHFVDVVWIFLFTFVYIWGA